MAAVAEQAVGGRKRWIAQRAMDAALFLIAAGVAFGLTRPALFEALTPVGSLGPVWPLSGVGFALVYLGGWRMAAGIFAGALMGALVAADNWSYAFPGAVANTLEAVLGVAIVRRITQEEHLFDQLRDLLRLLLVIGVSVPMIVGVIHAASSTLRTNGDWLSFLETWLYIIMTNGAGAVVYAPPLLIWARQLHQRQTQRWILETFLVLASAVALSAILFASGSVSGGHEYHMLLFLHLPLALFGLCRLGPAASSGVVLISAVMATAGTGLGVGPFAELGPRIGLLTMGTHLAVLAITPLIVGALLGERDRALEALADRERHAVLLRNELDHRVRNNLTSLSSLIDMSARDQGKGREFDAIRARVQAMSTVHGLLGASRLRPVRLMELVEQLVPAGSGKRVRYPQDDVLIAADRVQAMGLVLNELFENARVHGSLSRADGEVGITWQAEGTLLEVRWREVGSVIDMPVAEGRGIELIRGFVESELGGEVRFGFGEHGVDHEMIVRTDPRSNGA